MRNHIIIYLALFLLTGIFCILLTSCFFKSEPSPSAPDLSSAPLSAPDTATPKTPTTKGILQAKVSIDYRLLSKDGTRYNYFLVLKETNGLDVIFDTISREFLETGFLQKYDRDGIFHRYGFDGVLKGNGTAEMFGSFAIASQEERTFKETWYGDDSCGNPIEIGYTISTSEYQ